jgi:hypothetical protein
MPLHDWKRVDAGIFHDFHLSWVFRIRDFLNNGVLPDDYYALVEQRTGGKEPDDVTLHQSDAKGVEAEGDSLLRGPAQAATLTLELAPPQVAFVDELDDEFYVSKRRSIAIRHVSDDDLVSLIEIMSPGNKSSKSHIEQFLEKVVLAIQAGVHLLIVDLHPPTARDPRGIHGAIAQALGREQTRFDAKKPLTLVAYHASGETRAYVQPVAIGDALTTMPLFLSDEKYVNVPLEETYGAAFQSVPRHLRAVLESPAA